MANLKKQAKKERRRVKKLEPKDFEEIKREAMKQAKQLAKELESEPFPTRKSMVREHKDLIQKESVLAKMLSPLRKLVGIKPTKPLPEPTKYPGLLKKPKPISKKKTAKKAVKAPKKSKPKPKKKSVSRIHVKKRKNKK